MPRIKVKKRTLARRINLWGSRITAFAILAAAGVAIFSWLHKGKSHPARMSESEPGAASNGNVVKTASQALAVNLASLLGETNWDRAMSQPNLLEILHFPGNLDWSKDVLELSPSENARLKLAMQAVDFEGGPCWLAGALLDQVMKANSNNIAARIVAARTALLRKDLGRTEELLRASAKLEPTNYWHRLNLAACQLLQPKDALVLSEARGVLQTLCAKAEVSHHARLLLALESLRTNHVARGEEDVYALFQPSASKMEDRLLQLAQARAVGSPFPTNTLDNLEREAASQPWEACALALWMARAGQTASAIRWMESLSPQTVLQPPVGLALYLCAEEAEDWLLVEQRLQKARWEEADYLRLALLAKTAEQCKHRPERDSFWNGAIQMAAKSFGAHVALYGLARSWAWPERAEEMLWDIGREFRGQMWALKELERVYVRQRKMEGLRAVYEEMLKSEPRNPAFQKGFVRAAFLTRGNLDRGRLENAFRLAKDLYGVNQGDPETAATYAYSLHLQERTKAGVQLLNTLKGEDLKNPRVAAYYAVLLAHSGETAKAWPLLRTAQAGELWEEEKALLNEAARLLKGQQP